MREHESAAPMGLLQGHELDVTALDASLECVGARIVENFGDLGESQDRSEPLKQMRGDRSLNLGVARIE